MSLRGIVKGRVNLEGKPYLIHEGVMIFRTSLVLDVGEYVVITHDGTVEKAWPRGDGKIFASGVVVERDWAGTPDGTVQVNGYGMLAECSRGSVEMTPTEIFPVRDRRDRIELDLGQQTATCATCGDRDITGRMVPSMTGSGLLCERCVDRARSTRPQCVRCGRAGLELRDVTFIPAVGVVCSFCMATNGRSPMNPRNPRLRDPRPSERSPTPPAPQPAPQPAPLPPEIDRLQRLVDLE